MVPQKRIRPLALCVFRDGNRILVSDGVDPSDQTAYCRPLGGSIEFGELSADTVVREIREELGVEVRDVRLLGVLENLFTLDGHAGHEIVFVYDAQCADESLYRRDGIPFRETDRTSGFARWFDLSRAGDDPAQLAPEGLFDFLRKRAEKTGPTVVYKVSPPRKGMVFEPSVFYRTEDFKSSSNHPKPGYIKDTLLYAGDRRGISLHLFPNISRVEVRLDGANRQKLAELGFATVPDKEIAIFVNATDEDKIPGFTPTVYSFDAADFEKTPSNEYVSRKPVRAVGVEELTMPEVLQDWRIQVIAVQDVSVTENQIRQAGVHCSSETGRWA